GTVAVGNIVTSGGFFGTVAGFVHITSATSLTVGTIEAQGDHPGGSFGDGNEVILDATSSSQLQINNISTNSGSSDGAAGKISVTNHGTGGIKLNSATISASGFSTNGNISISGSDVSLSGTVTLRNTGASGSGDITITTTTGDVSGPSTFTANAGNDLILTGIAGGDITTSNDFSGLLTLTAA